MDPVLGLTVYLEPDFEGGCRHRSSHYGRFDQPAFGTNGGRRQKWRPPGMSADMTITHDGRIIGIGLAG
jgi:hypothetical protein